MWQKKKKKLNQWKAIELDCVQTGSLSRQAFRRNSWAKYIQSNTVIKIDTYIATDFRTALIYEIHSQGIGRLGVLLEDTFPKCHRAFTQCKTNIQELRGYKDWDKHSNI